MTPPHPLSESAACEHLRGTRIAERSADKRAAAIDGLRKSNAATQPGGNPVDLKFTQEQMQGLDAVVAAQASCM